MGRIGDTGILSGSDEGGTLMMSGGPSGEVSGQDGGHTEVKSVLGNTRLVSGETQWGSNLGEDTLG